MSPLPPRHILSKSTFIRGCQCAKSLWLYKHQYKLRDTLTQSQAAIFQRGTDVGLLAQQLFPKGVDASPIDAFHYRQSVAATVQYIAKGHTVIYEAAFQYEGVMCAIDILVKRGDKWYAFEVKSSTKVKEQFVQDAALQYWVITNAGLALEDISLIHINQQYVRSGALDINQLFNLVSLKDNILEQQAFVATKVAELKAVALNKQMPVMATGPYCKLPYKCDFHGHCWKDFVEKQTPEANAVVLNHEIKNFIDSLTYPLYFADFQSYMLPVPEYDGHWPFRQIPFQFSVHRQPGKHAALVPTHFLAKTNCNPCSLFIEKFVAALGDTGSIIVYNKTAESHRLADFKKDYPQFAEALTSIQSRLVDLTSPFHNKYFVHPAISDNYSLKNVLPAIVPGLTFGQMLIENTDDASAAFYNLRYENNPANVNQLKQALSDFAELNTLAMVELLEQFKEISRQKESDIEVDPV